jgi:type VI secretion system protein ImpC
MVEETVGTAGGHPWAVVGGLYQFGATAEDAALLTHIARLAWNSGAAFVSDAAPQLVGCSSFAQTPDPRDWQVVMNGEAESAWQVLRRSPEAQHVCLAAPRVLLRLPYGADTSRVEAFAYEEMPHGPAHDQYLWGHASIACIQALGALFARRGWQLQPSSRHEIEDLPLHVFNRDGESVFYPPSEAFLTERALWAATGQGVTALVSIRDRDAVAINGIRSVAGGDLAGPWSAAK